MKRNALQVHHQIYLSLIFHAFLFIFSIACQGYLCFTAQISNPRTTFEVLQILFCTSTENNPTIINLDTSIRAMRTNVQATLDATLNGLQITKEDLAREASRYSPSKYATDVSFQPAFDYNGLSHRLMLHPVSRYYSVILHIHYLSYSVASPSPDLSESDFPRVSFHIQHSCQGYLCFTAQISNPRTTFEVLQILFCTA